MVLAVAGLTLWAPPAHAATVYEITGDWEAGTPSTVAKGDVVTGVFRVNVNDDRAAPSNDPVDNVTLTVTAQHGLFKGLPDVCLTGASLTPPSSISDDGRTLTCNLGTVRQGTAVVVQTPIVADGITGDVIDVTGEIDGQTAPLDPIAIVNSFGMDMLWGTPTGTLLYKDNDGIAFDFEWTLFQDEGSDAGPDSVTYNLDIPVANGMRLYLSEQGPNPPFNTPCTPFQNSRPAEGHPYSRGGTDANRAPFVESCTLEQTGPNSFRMTISGIDYSLTQVPTEDSAGNPLPSDKVAVASGSIWLEVRGLTANTSAQLTASAPLYQSVTGQLDPDETNNNTSSITITFPGTWSHAWIRTDGGRAWDNTFKLSPGASVTSVTSDWIAATGVPAATPVGDCAVLDTAFTDYESVKLMWRYPEEFFVDAPDGVGRFEWYVGTDPTVTPGSAGYNPDAFTGCDGGAGWTATEPVNRATVKAVRWVGTAGDLGFRQIQVHTTHRIQDNAPIGQDVWTWGGVIRNGAWIYPGREGSDAVITPTPNDRYSNTNGGRDILHVIYAVPNIAKRVDRAVVRPGVPATYTLIYSANGSGSIPATVDDYRIVDVLPLGMTYVDDSADPPPAVTTDPQGREVLTWVLDDVPTNTQNRLTYQAVVDGSVEPGQTLTNTATSSLRGESSRPATAQVTTSTSGSTQISKTADTPFIPNLDGNGDGEGVWTVTVRSFDPLPQAFTDTIDILPWEGDGRGTDYDGSYSLSAVDVPDGQTVYYTDADPALLSDDPAALTNGAPNAPSALWSTTKPANPTAIRVIGPELAPGATQQFRVRIQTDGAHGEDVFVNRAQSRAGHTQLVMRTSSSMTVANYYSATLKKYVQDRNGVWRDANDVADAPVFKYGDTVRYRIVVTNTGQGTLTDIDVSDDKQPELGSFHIDSLAPGESASHEFEFVLDKSVDGTLTNTACAEAAIPADSQVPPTINCDPAKLLVSNYTTVKTSDPVPGSAVVPGDKVKYTVTLTQEGSAPAAASFSDDLSDVLDDASYNGDVQASLGTARFENGRIVWADTIPVGGVVRVTYSVTVKEKKGRDMSLYNVVASDGCQVKAGKAVNCDTEHKVPKFDLALDKKVISGRKATVGEKVRYRIQVTNKGPDAAPAPIKLSDPLPDGLQLVSARGKTWDCDVKKATDVVRCRRDTDLGPGRKAPPVIVVAKTTAAAVGRVVNVAKVKAGGDRVRSNNRDVAGVSVGAVPPLPGTGFRIRAPFGSWF